MKVLKKSVAKSLGKITYFNGKKCPKGHLELRYVSTGQCIKCLRGFTKKYRNADWEKYLESARKYYWENRDEKRRQYKIWYHNNKSIAHALTKKWHKRNPLGRRIHTANGRARFYGCEGKFTADEIKALLKKQEFLCVYCEKSLKRKFTVDHKKALAKEGKNIISNIQLLCKRCNDSKHTKDADEFRKVFNQKRKARK